MEELEDTKDEEKIKNLDEEIQYHFQKALDFTEKFISAIMKSKGDTYNALKTSSTTLHACIYYFKFIGACFEKATKLLGLTTTGRNANSVALRPWVNLIYLRNALIHHCLVKELPTEGIQRLDNILKDISAIKKYLKMVINKNYLMLNDCEKIWENIFEFSTYLKNQYSRNLREDQKKSNYYPELISEAIDGIEKLTKNMKISVIALNELEKNSFLAYLALQNLLELIAVITTPNKENNLISDKLRNDILQKNPEASTWLSSLGQNRNTTIHQAILLDTESLATHLNEMIQLGEILSEILSPQNSSLFTDTREKQRGSLPNTQKEQTTSFSSYRFKEMATSQAKAKTQYTRGLFGQNQAASTHSITPDVNNQRANRTSYSEEEQRSINTATHPKDEKKRKKKKESPQNKKTKNFSDFS